MKGYPDFGRASTEDSALAPCHAVATSKLPLLKEQRLTALALLNC